MKLQTNFYIYIFEEIFLTIVFNNLLYFQIKIALIFMTSIINMTYFYKHIFSIKH